MAFPGLTERVSDVRARIEAARARGGHGQQVTIVAVTKTHGPEAAQAAYESGLHDVGENKVQEALKKMAAVDVPVRWHLIGHLQRNKVKALEQFVLLHSLDSPRLAGTAATEALAAVVFAASSADVRHVMASGRWIVRDGAHLTLDVRGELARATAALAPA